MTEGQWPDSPPQIFLDYPILINDLGRAFQFTSSGREGLDLFLKWDESLPDDLRYRLVFFAARIARRRGMNEQGLLLFEQARELAPDSEQLDACIWYILDMSLRESTSVFLERLEKLAPYLQRCNSIDDIMERNLHLLVSRREWDKIMRAFDAVKDKNTTIRAGYAGVIARIIEEVYLDNSSLPETTAAGYIRKAYDASAIRETAAAHYYRSLSASVLELPFLELPRAPAASKPTPALQFLLGFFQHGAADLSVRYIRSMENYLSPNELRSVAKAFEQAGMYALAIRQVSRYINREGHTRTIEDMEILYPRAYKELIERHAGEYGISAPIMFALIRTESAFQSAVVSHAGAVGLSQLMPATAQDMADRIRRSGGPNFFDEDRNLDLNDPELNLSIGAFYFNSLIGRFEDIKLALMAYNGGQNRVRRWRNANPYMPIDLFLETIIFFETRDYGRKVIGAAAVYEKLYY
jgi:soluble lytic murein transglycosylase